DHEDPLIPCDTVFVNNYDCMYRLTKYLLGIGHRNVLFAGNIRFSRSFYDRWTGFRNAIEDYGIPLREDHLTELEGIENFTEQFKSWSVRSRKSRSLPTAVVCANDTLAIDAIQAFRELGMSVPEDISVSGFDNIEAAYRMRPALTTVHVPKESLGRRAVDRLLERIESPSEPLEKVLLAG